VQLAHQHRRTLRCLGLRERGGRRGCRSRGSVGGRRIGRTRRGGGGGRPGARPAPRSTGGGRPGGGGGRRGAPGGGREGGGRDRDRGVGGGRDRGGFGGGRRGGPREQRIYTVEPAREVSEQRSDKGEATSLSSLRSLLNRNEDEDNKKD